MKGSDAVVLAMKRNSVRAVFCVPGSHTLPLLESLRREIGIEQVVSRSESNAAFMADGYSRASGEVGVCLTSTGPGALNTIAALATAHSDGSPVLHLFTQIPMTHINRRTGFVHEIAGQLNLFSSVTGWRASATNCEELPSLIDEAFASLNSDSPSPAALEIPMDLLGQRFEASFPAKRETVVDRTRLGDVEIEDTRISEAAEVLRSANSPVVFVGSGVEHDDCASTIIQIAERLAAPIILTPPAKGTIHEDHPLCIGCTSHFPATLEVLKQADALLAFGSALSSQNTSDGKLPLPDTIVQIAISKAVTAFNYCPRHMLCGPIPETAYRVLAKLMDVVPKKSGTEERCERVLRDVRSSLSTEGRYAVDYLDAIRRALPRNAVVVNDVAIAAYWGWAFLPMYDPRTYLYPWAQATLGFGFPAALGAKVAKKDVPVVAICGDGGFLASSCELATAVQHGLNVIAIIFNDNGYGIIRYRQKSRYGATNMAELYNPSFRKFASSFGAHFEMANDPTELESCVARALTIGRVSIIEVPVSLANPFDEFFK